MISSQREHNVKRKPYEGEMKEQKVTSTSQGISQRLPTERQKLGENPETGSPKLFQKVINLVDIWILGSNLQNYKPVILLFKSSNGLYFVISTITK